MHSTSKNIQLEPRFCTLCGIDAGKSLKYPGRFELGDFNAEIFSARRSPDRRHFQIQECNQCGMLYSDPACSIENLSKLYEKSTVTYEETENHIYNSYVPVLNKALARTQLRKSFCEIGGGRGFMLSYGAQHNFSELIEVEPSTDAEARFLRPTPNSRFVRDLFTKNLFETGALEKSSASLVCFFQILDHVPNPRAFLETVWELLAPGGVMVCVTHNTRALSAKLLGERSPIFDIEHTYLFNKNNLSQLLVDVGFSEPKVWSISNNYTLDYWSHLAPLPGRAKRFVKQVVSYAGGKYIKIPLYAGNFAASAIKR